MGPPVLRNPMSELGDWELLERSSSEDAGVFTDEGLAPFAAVIFLSTSGDILNGVQQQAFERYVGGGGGFLGIHAASDTEYDWAWYGELVGAYFANHPLVEDFVDCHCFTATVERHEPHPIVDGLPGAWEHRDEWYNFSQAPVQVEVLLTVDESTYEGGEMGDLHPVSWAHDKLGGRAFYTAMGHTSQSFDDARFRRHLGGALRWIVADSP